MCMCEYWSEIRTQLQCRYKDKPKQSMMHSEMTRFYYNKYACARFQQRAHSQKWHDIKSHSNIFVLHLLPKKREKRPLKNIPKNEEYED